MGPGEVLDVVVVTDEALVRLPVLYGWWLVRACFNPSQRLPAAALVPRQVPSLPNVEACDGGLLSRWYMQMILSSAPEAR